MHHDGHRRSGDPHRRCGLLGREEKATGGHDVASYIESADGIYLDLENNHSGDNGSNAAVADSVAWLRAEGLA